MNLSPTEIAGATGTLVMAVYGVYSAWRKLWSLIKPR